jgi:hypothetical protein
MPPFLYRCPNTGFNVQGYAPNDHESERGGEVFIGITCLACGLVHPINPKTGKTVSEDGE